VDTDDDAIFRSTQNLDCELRPPKSDSYFNLYDDEMDVPLGGSAHSLRNLLVGSSSSTTGGRESPSERRLAPDAMYSPVGHASGNVVMQHHSDIRVNSDDATAAYFLQKPTVIADKPQSRVSDTAVLPSDAKYPTTQALAPDDFGAGLLHVSAGRRPGRVSPTKAKDAAATVQTAALPVAESDVLAITDVNITSNVRRPMSFVKALELSDRLEESQRKRYGAGQLHDVSVPEVDEDGEHSDIVEKDSKRKFGSSYEIAV